MKKLPIIALAIGFVLLLVAGGLWMTGSAPQADGADPVLQPGDPDLSIAFRETSDRLRARRDARHFAAVCRALADKIEWDGRQSSPRIRTGVHLDDLRRWGRHLQLNGRSYGETYPTLAVVVGEYLDANVGNSGGVLTNEHRARYVAAFRALARSSEAAAQQ